MLLLGRSAARWRPDGLGGAREVEEVRALGVVELQRARQRVEHAVGRSGQVAAFQARVVRDAHAGEDGDLLAPQAGDAARAVVGQADVGGLEPGSPGGQELADLAARVHRLTSVDPLLPAWGTLPGSPSQGLPHGVRACFRGAGRDGDEHLPQPRRRRRLMRATLMYAAGDVRVEDVPDPSIVEPTDAIIRVTSACICGSDLWPYADLEPTETGRPMGHEAIGLVEDVGPDVRTVKPGDLVVMPFAFSDGTCAFCQRGTAHRLRARRLLRRPQHWRRAGRGRARSPRRRDALRAAGRRGRRADAVAADALRRARHRPPRRRRGRRQARATPWPSSATAPSGSAA